jgi:uncharacterized membrane protein YdjX (TVP38/TMEM64 family)
MTSPAPPPAGLGQLALKLSPLAAVALLGFAAFLLPGDPIGPVLDWLQGLRTTPMAAPAAVGTFVVLASIGAPQVVTIPALVLVFGPVAGFFYSWIGKVIACALGFLVGRRFGATLVARYASPKVQLVMDQLGRHGFAASAIIRLAPTIPSVLINLAAGCTPIKFLDFTAGAAVGSIPKMALIAFAGHAAIAGLAGGGAGAWLSLGGAVGLLALLAVIGRALMRRTLATPPPDGPAGP